mmetsp:Transcript_30747/g.69377  ORF Transcript_30747/g.69377 Transcript_30747/m.69377 type:complete len:246 (-) Transcript_30747:96-833(-)
MIEEVGGAREVEDHAKLSPGGVDDHGECEQLHRKADPEPSRWEALRAKALNGTSVPALERLKVVGANLGHCAHELIVRFLVGERCDVDRFVPVEECLRGGRGVLDHSAAVKVVLEVVGPGDGPDAPCATGGHAIALVANHGHPSEEKVVAHVERVGLVGHAEIRVCDLDEGNVLLEGDHRALILEEEGGHDVLPEALVDRVASVDDPVEHRATLRWRLIPLLEKLHHDRIHPEVEAASLAEMRRE